jgi:predicted flap endonuclease-1-like 5' DNA nuclease
MSGFMCCIWWFVFGVLVGWLLSWLFNKLLGGGSSGNSGSTNLYTPPARPPVTPVTPVTPTAPVTPVAPVVPAINPKAAMIAAAAAAGFTISGEDDLKIVEGIGPKIDALLKEHGVRTFAQLAKTDIPSISAILDKGGARFKLANPGSWAEQAALAAANKWHELKKLQDELTAGVRYDEDGNQA